jgi:hypothetical protein
MDGVAPWLIEPELRSVELLRPIIPFVTVKSKLLRSDGEIDDRLKRLLLNGAYAAGEPNCAKSKLKLVLASPGTAAEENDWRLADWVDPREVWRESRFLYSLSSFVSFST